MKRAFLLLAICLIGCHSTTPQTDRRSAEGVGVGVGVGEAGRVQVERSTSGLVVSDSPIASRIGADVLADGGNAVDAAVATAFAMAVTWPEAGNLGGGGFMLVAPADADVRFIDYRETAPAASTIDMYTPGENRHRARHAGVPGTVAGLALAHEQMGTQPWRDLVRPAVELARDGFEVDAALAESLNDVLLDEETRTSPELAELRRVYGKPGGGAWSAGDVLTLPDLAETLETIANEGPAGFYEGAVAESLAAFMAESNGLITAEDLANYEAKEREPIRFAFRGHDVYGAPPPSSGGVTTALILQMLETFDLENAERYDPETIHLMAEAMRRAFHQRALELGDPDFVDLPIDRLTSAAFARELAATIDPNHATPSTALEPAIPLAEEPNSTTHFSVIDEDGMAVANTYTLEQAWGSRVIPDGLGFVLNNEMGDFNWVPGRTTRGGAIGTAPNVIAPGKRPLSSMAPTIVMRDGEVVLVTGSPGGRTIINTVACLVLNVLAFEMSPAEAVAAPRMHHQWLPDVLRLETPGEDGPHAAAADALKAMGHTIEFSEQQGSAHTIWVDVETGLQVGVADYRRGGLAASPE